MENIIETAGNIEDSKDKTKYEYTENLSEECQQRLFHIFRDYPNPKEKVEEMAKRIHNYKVRKGEVASVRVHKDFDTSNY